MATHKMLQAAAIVAASVWIGGCTQFTGTDDVSLDGEPITDGNGKPNAPALLPPNRDISCAYPFADVYGPSMGQTIGSDNAWMGYPAGEDGARLFEVTELYDCTLEDVHAIIFDTSQYG